MVPETIEMIADRVLALDDADLLALLNHYKDRISQDEPTRAWERAVIAYFLINGIRMKNVLKQDKVQRQKLKPSRPPQLRLVKA
ncbi:MAG: hypothetical protein JRI59_02405 [Deltaproteobacteria bacterium]|nr:hypothetical protein [Deltaproteobacteria bacterium]